MPQDPDKNKYSQWYGLFDGKYEDQLIAEDYSGIEGVLDGGSGHTFTLLRTTKASDGRDIHDNKLTVNGGNATSMFRAVAPYSSGTEKNRLKIYNNVLEITGERTTKAHQISVVHGGKASYSDVYNNTVIYAGGEITGFLRGVLLGGTQTHIFDNLIQITGNVITNNVCGYESGTHIWNNRLEVTENAILSVAVDSHVALGANLDENHLIVDGQVTSGGKGLIFYVAKGSNKYQGQDHKSNQMTVTETGKFSDFETLTLIAAGNLYGTDSATANSVSITGGQSFKNIDRVSIYAAYHKGNGNVFGNVVSLTNVYDLENVGEVIVYGGHSKNGSYENVKGNILNINGTVEVTAIGYGHEPDNTDIEKESVSSFQEIHIADGSHLSVMGLNRDSSGVEFPTWLVEGTLPLIGTNLHLGKDARLDVKTLVIKNTPEETNHLTFTADFTQPQNGAMISVGQLEGDGAITIDAINILGTEKLPEKGTFTLFEANDGGSLDGLILETTYEEGLIGKTVTSDGVWSFKVDSDNLGQILVTQESSPETSEYYWEDILNSTDESINALTIEESIALSQDIVNQKDLTIFGNGYSVTSADSFTVNQGKTLSLDDVDMSVHHLINKGILNVGRSTQESSTLFVDKFTSEADSQLVVDPSWDEQPSIFTANEVVGAIDGSVVAAQNSLVAFGTDAEEALSLMAKFGALDEATGYSSALVIAKPISLTGKIVVNGTLTTGNADIDAYASGTLTVDKKGLLVVDNDVLSANEPLVDGIVNLVSGATLAVAHAKEGTFQLANEVKVDDNISILTDGDYIQTVIDGNTIQNRLVLDLDKTIASMGMQALSSQASSNFSQAIDAHLLSQPSTFKEKPLSLWVAVSGEKYKADGLAHNGQYDSDMGYSHFGADIALGSGFRVGVAMQYNTGSLKSDNYNIENNIDGFGLALYTSWLPCPGAHLTAKTTYLHESNELSGGTQFFSLNSDVTTEVYTLGLSTGYTMEFANVSVTPEVGLTVAQMTTEGFSNDMGEVKREKQTLVQVPVAVNVAWHGLSLNSWDLTPMARLSYTPTFGDKDYETTVINNGHVHQVDATVLTTSMVQGDLGVRAVNGPWSVEAKINAGTGNDETSSLSGHLSIHYAF